MLLLSCLFVLSYAATFSGPNCTWQCNDPHCPAVCTPLCLEPVCEVQCNSTQTCAPAVCTVQCSETQSPTESCPLCETVCAPPVCAPTVVGCETYCEAPNCTWSCRKPTTCAYPVCQLQCELPVCASVSFATHLGPAMVMLMVMLIIMTMQ